MIIRACKLTATSRNKRSVHSSAKHTWGRVGNGSLCSLSLPGLALAVCGVALSLLPVGGCLSTEQVRPPSTLASRWRLKPIAPGVNDVLMKVMFLERPFGDPLMNKNLWQSADDAELDIAVRRTLEARGFRIAVLGGPIPAALKCLFSEERPGQMNGEYVQMQSGNPTQIQTSGEYTSWPRDDGKGALANSLEYMAAVGSLRVIPTITLDGSVELGITPEIQHGPAARHFVPTAESHGPLDWTIEVGRQIRSFDELMFSLRLVGEQYAMLSCLPDDRGSLAARFFTRLKDGRPVQRVVLIQADPSPTAVARRTLP